MNISMKNDYSYLFNSLSSRTSNQNGLFNINLSDYASIKSGGYGKLMKAYYQTDISDTSDKGKTASSSEDILTKLTNAKKTASDTSETKDAADGVTSSSATSSAKVSSAKDYLDTILESSRQLYAATGGYTDSSSVVAGATLDTAV